MTTLSINQNYGNPQTVDDVPPVTYCGCDFREEFLTMYLCVKRRNLWGRILARNGGHFMFTNDFDDVLYSKYIEDNGKSVDGCGHSGATEAYCARLVEFVAMHGWDEFVKKFNNSV
jgi:hypothetical protein